MIIKNKMTMKTMTKTAGKTATSKSVANAKAGKAVRTLSLQQQLIKAERDLKNITVIHFQNKVTVHVSNRTVRRTFYDN